MDKIFSLFPSIVPNLLLVDKVINADSEVDAEMKSKNPKANLKALICVLIRTTTKLLHPKKYEDFLRWIEKADSDLYEFLVEAERNENESETSIRETDVEKTDRLLKTQKEEDRKKQNKIDYIFYITIILGIVTFVSIGIVANFVFSFVTSTVLFPIIWGVVSNCFGEKFWSD